MKSVGAVVGLVSIGLVAFGWWGTFTPSGNHSYDEMEGLYPAALTIGAIGTIVGAGLILVSRGRPTNWLRPQFTLQRIMLAVFWMALCFGSFNFIARADHSLGLAFGVSVFALGLLAPFISVGALFG